MQDSMHSWSPIKVALVLSLDRTSAVFTTMTSLVPTEIHIALFTLPTNRCTLLLQTRVYCNSSVSVPYGGPHRKHIKRIMKRTFTIFGYAVAQLFEAVLYKPEGRGFDSRLGHWNSLLTYSFRPHCGSGVDSASNRNEYQESFLEVKTAGA